MKKGQRQDLWAGLSFTAAGIGFSIGATNYSFGQAARPGPGYFPFGLGLILAALGVIILLRAFLGHRGEPDAPREPVAWRPLLISAAAIVVFGLSLDRLGMAITLPLLIIVISAAGDQFRWRDVLLNAAALTAGSWLIFIYGLKLTIPVWPAFID